MIADGTVQDKLRSAGLCGGVALSLSGDFDYDLPFSRRGLSLTTEKSHAKTREVEPRGSHPAVFGGEPRMRRDPTRQAADLQSILAHAGVSPHSVSQQRAKK